MVFHSFLFSHYSLDTTHALNTPTWIGRIRVNMIVFYLYVCLMIQWNITSSLQQTMKEQIKTHIFEASSSSTEDTSNDRDIQRLLGSLSFGGCLEFVVGGRDLAEVRESSQHSAKTKWFWSVKRCFTYMWVGNRYTQGEGDTKWKYQVKLDECHDAIGSHTQRMFGMGGLDSVLGYYQ